MFFQSIEDTWSISVFISGIKSEVDFSFVGIFRIVGMILAKSVDRGIPDRTFALLLETESPTCLLYTSPSPRDRG